MGSFITLSAERSGTTGSESVLCLLPEGSPTPIASRMDLELHCLLEQSLDTPERPVRAVRD
jgi:hypothetical protein